MKKLWKSSTTIKNTSALTGLFLNSEKRRTMTLNNEYVTPIHVLANNSVEEKHFFCCLGSLICSDRKPTEEVQ